MHVHTHARTHTRMHTHTHAHTHACTHTRMHTHIHTLLETTYIITCTQSLLWHSAQDQGGSLDDSPPNLALKILYTPQTDLTRSILEKANRTWNSRLYHGLDRADSQMHTVLSRQLPPYSPQVDQARQVIDLMLSASAGSIGTIPASQLNNNLGQNITFTNQSLLLDAKHSSTW